MKSEQKYKSNVEVDTEGECVVTIPLSVLTESGIKIGSEVLVETCLDETASKYCILISQVESPKVVVKPNLTAEIEDVESN